MTNTLHQRIRREFLPLCQKILDSPYVLALLAGLWPIAFYISNNWFMFEPSRIPFIVGAFTSIIWLTLSLFYFVLSQLWRRVLNPNESKAALRIFVFVSILVMAYLLRRPFSPMVSFSVFLVIAVLIALTLAWFIPRVHIFRVNIVLAVMSLPVLGMGLNSIFSTRSGPTIFPHTEIGFDAKEDALRQAIYAQVRFSKKPNVYYIVPDGYPNAEALKAIFNLEAKDFHEQLESSGFAIYPSIFTNYSDTLSSMSSVLGMDHHYYRGTVGNLEFLDARKFIVSTENPVVKIFRNNGYQIHYVHQDDFLFSSGCLVDSCWPMPFWGSELMGVLVSTQFKSTPLLARVRQAIAARGGVAQDKQTRLELFMQRAREHIDSMAEQHIPHFTYMHLDSPSHSLPGPQTSEQLASFRKDYGKEIQLANDEILGIVSHILTRDTNALIIVNADHGAWGYGNTLYTNKELLAGISDYLVGLDHLGALLAIRWPDAVPRYDQDLRTNVNLFRHIFSYLSESKEILTTKVPDDGFVWSRVGVQKKVRKVMDDGRVLEHMIEVDPVTGREFSRK
jgi:hypothetical protein